MLPYLRVQRYLLDYGLDRLVKEFHIQTHRHAQFPNLVSLHYHQFESPLSEPLVRECRGLVLDRDEGWRVRCHSFDKFFNHGEPRAALIDWDTARVQEKLDGTLVQLYFYEGEWQVATSRTPDGSGNVVATNIQGHETFADLFWRTHAAIGYSLPRVDRRHETFAFELTTPQNRVIVGYPKCGLTLLAVRDNATGRERRPSLADGYPLVREFPLQGFAQVLATFEQMKPLEQEGYVVVDGRFNRVKVKHPGYVALAHMASGGPTPKRVLEVIRSGERDEVLASFPEWREVFDRVSERLASVEAAIERDWRFIKKEQPFGTKEEQKQVAQRVKATFCPNALFALLRGKAPSVRGYLMGLRTEQLLPLLHLEEDEGVSPASASVVE